MRDLMMLGGMIFLIPLALSNGLAAYLLWGWTAVLSPVYYLYGFMQSVRFNLMFAAIALVLLLIKGLGKKPFKPSAAFLLMLWFLAHTVMSIGFGYDNNPFNEQLGTQFFKSVLFCLVMSWFVNNREHMHAMFIMVALGLGFHGVVEGLKVLATGGGHHVAGIPTSMMSDNNHFGVAMVMVIPILYYLHQYSANKLARLGFLVALFLTVITILGTQSRGGMIALSVVGIWFFITSQYKLRALALLIIVAGMVAYIAPESWFDRMNSINQAGSDSSFMGRVAAWKISSAIALENPVFGGGFHALQVQHVWDRFKYSQGMLGFVATPEPDLRAKAAHSIYFEIMGDMGFVGLLLFVSIFATAILARYEIKGLVARHGEKYNWAVDKANALMLAIVAYLVGGAAVSLAYFELPFMLVMLMEMLRQYIRQETSAKSPVAA